MTGSALTIGVKIPLFCAHAADPVGVGNIPSSHITLLTLIVSIFVGIIVIGWAIVHAGVYEPDRQKTGGLGIGLEGNQPQERNNYH